MYLQEILEVAIGLVFMWLIISVAAMSIQEWIANLLEWRSTDLENSIRKMLADPDLAKQFYNHQMIRGLSKDANGFTKARDSFANFFRRKFKLPEKVFEYKPSYIPANDFALTLFDMVLQAGTEASPIQRAFGSVNEALASLKDDQINFEDREDVKKALQVLLDAAKDAAASDVGQDTVDSIKFKVQQFAADHPQLKDALDLAMPQVDAYYQRIIEENRNAPPPVTDADAAKNKDKTLLRLRLGLAAIGMQSPKLQESLRSLLTGAEGYITDKETALMVARKNVETWFDNSMTRLSGWYKRKAQVAAFIIGLGLAILLNVDSVIVATSLWREPTLRQTIVAQAEAYAQANPELPVANKDGQTDSPKKSVKELQADLADLRIPFGWDTETILLKEGQTCQIVPISKNSIWGIWSANACQQLRNASTPDEIPSFWVKMLGILLTALAAAQGAPFWFDILKKLVNVRSSGANPAEEKPKG
jgi:hypothetical protein